MCSVGELMKLAVTNPRNFSSIVLWTLKVCLYFRPEKRTHHQSSLTPANDLIAHLSCLGRRTVVRFYSPKNIARLPGWQSVNC
jgi:hypothetical protein